MFKRNIEIGRCKLEKDTRGLENIRINEKVNNREKKEPHVEPMNLDVIMNCSRAYLIANAKNK